MRKDKDNRETKHWLVYANASRCNHYASLKEAGFISWKRERNNFAIGDIVYIFSSMERRIIYKTEVVAEEIRADGKYWIENPPMHITWRLNAIEEYIGNSLDEVTINYMDSRAVKAYNIQCVIIRSYLLISNLSLRNDW